MNVPSSRASLIVAIDARLEQAEADLSRAALAWLESQGRGDEAASQGARERALGELWRRESLESLRFRVQGAREDQRYFTIFFVALDACDPAKVPSFKEWLSRRNPEGG